MKRAINQKKAGVLLTYTSELIKILTALIYTPIMLRLLGQSEYGLYQLVFSVVSYLGLLSLGFTAAYIRFYSIFKEKHQEEEIARLNGMFMTVFLIIAVVAALCGAGMVYSIHGIFGSGLTESEYATAKVLMGLMVFNLCISFPNSVFSCIISAHERFFFQRLLTVLQNLLNPFLTFPLLLLGYGSIGLVVISTILSISRFLADIIFVFGRLHVRFLFRGFQISLLKSIGLFTFFIFLNQIIDQVNWSVDRFLLGRMIGTSAVAIYGLGGQINTMYLQISSAVSSVFVPQINRIVAGQKSDHDLSVLFKRIGRIQFLLLGLVLTGFVLLGHPFMKLWAGNNYGDSYFIALLLIIPVTVPLIQNIGIEIQRAKNMHKARSVVYFCIAIANVLLSIPLIRAFGPMGAALGTAISLIAGNIFFMNWYYAYRIGLEIRDFWKSILSLAKAMILPFVLGILALRFVEIENWTSLLIFAGVYSIIYCVSVWNFGMNVSEKKSVTDIIGKFRRRP